MILQHPQQDAEGLQGSHTFVLPKTLHQGEKIPADFLQGLGRLGRLHQGKTTQRLLRQVPVDSLFLNRLENNPVLPLQVDQKVMDALGKNADPSQSPHVGTDVHGIDPLLGGLHPEYLRQDLRRGMKKLSIQTAFRNPMPERPEGLGAQILRLVRLAGNVQGIVPLEIERKLGDRLLVRQIVHLLEDQRPKGGIDLLGRTAETLRVAGGNLPNGQLGKDMLPEQTGPGSIQQFASFRPQVVPRVDQVGCFVIADMNHGGSTYLMNI